MRYKLYKYTNEIAKYATLIRFLLCLDMKFAQKRMEMCLNLFAAKQYKAICINL